MATTIKYSDIVDQLSYKETSGITSNYYKLSFSVGASGPSFGPSQLDFGTGPNLWPITDTARSTLKNILSANGYTTAQINIIMASGETITHASYTQKKQDFEFIIGDGNTTAGQAELNQINTILAANANYINAQSSASIDTVTTDVNNYFAAANYSGSSTGVAPLLAELDNQVGNLQWLSSYGDPTTVSGASSIEAAFTSYEVALNGATKGNAIAQNFINS